MYTIGTKYSKGVHRLLDPAVHGMGAPKGDRKQSSLAFPTRLNRPKPRSRTRKVQLFRKFQLAFCTFPSTETDPKTPIHPQSPKRLPRIDIPAPERSDHDLKIFDFPKFCNLYGFSRLWLTHFPMDSTNAVQDLHTSIPSGKKS